VLYPLSYGGSATWESVPADRPVADTRRHSVQLLVHRRYSHGVTHGLGRVLVVDDDEVIRQLIAVNLQLEGFDVSTAIDGQDCLDRVVEIDPDVITLDVMMPRLDGWETAVQLRKSPETAHIKVVLITARAQEEDKAHGGRVGADAYLTKPFDPNEMIRVIRELAGAPAS
jgi:DNA-binding response OmpR family regulator